MNGFVVLGAMIAIYGGYAIFHPRVRVRQSGRVLIVMAWVLISICALALTAAAAGPAARIAHPTPDHVGKLLFCFGLYAICMSLLLAGARVLVLTTPLLLVAHGFAIAAKGADELSFLFPMAVALSPVVLYAAMHDNRKGSSLGDAIRIVSYLWAATVLIAYTVVFISDELVHGELLGTALVVLPLLLVRLGGFAALLVLLLPQRGDVIGGYVAVLGAISAYSQIQRVPTLIAVSLSAIAAGVMLLALDAGEAPLVFVASFSAAQALGFAINPREPAPTLQSWSSGDP